MRKTKVTLLAQTILQIEAGTHEAVRDGGNLYILLQQEEGIEDASSSDDAPEPKKEVAKAPAKATPKPATAKAPEVVDDVEEPKKAPARGTAKKPATKPEPVADEPEEILEDAWGDLEEGTAVLCQLDMEGEDGDKLWEATIVGWKKPKGSRDEKLYVTFTEDGQEDYLRDGDKLFSVEDEGL